MDEITGALIGLAALCGLAMGDSRGSRRLARALENEREYLRGQVAAKTGEPYHPPPPPAGLKLPIPIPFPDFGKKHQQEVA